MRIRIDQKKSLGQHFLVDSNVAAKIVGSLRAPGDGPVIEIGAGTGALTELLAARYSRLIALEIDERAVALLRSHLPHVDVRHEDVLEIDWATLSEMAGARLFVIGNLPYFITSPILFGLFDSSGCIAEAVLMTQLELANRLVAVPRTKAYGILSVVAQLHGTPEMLFKVSRNVFRPKPDVSSAVLRLTFHEKPRIPDTVDPVLVRRVVRAAFNQRRKTLHNSLSAWTREKGLPLPDHFRQRRAEELTPDEFVTLAHYLADR